MTFIPILKSEVQGRGVALSLGQLASLAEGGECALRLAACNSPVKGTLNDKMIMIAYDAVKEAWGGVTLDLPGKCAFTPTTGYAVTTGTVRVLMPADGCLRAFARAVLEAALRIPAGQYLGIFRDDMNRVHLDSVHICNSRVTAFAVATARHSAGGVYNFATGGSEWPPYLMGSK